MASWCSRVCPSIYSSGLLIISLYAQVADWGLGKADCVGREEKETRVGRVSCWDGRQSTKTSANCMVWSIDDFAKLSSERTEPSNTHSNLITDACCGGVALGEQLCAAEGQSQRGLSGRPSAGALPAATDEDLLVWRGVLMAFTTDSQGSMILVKQVR
jgi:hypothetical protein